MLSYLTQNSKHHLCEDTLKKIPETHFSLKKIYNFMEIHLMIFEAVCYENQNDTAICGSD